mmetsp:Transcript_12977/g.29620  ORF Transcript_12977/g.29620 Transcript_12977/m.29620 type:complete len:177 (+) Transcript_12977:2290-2820(+)
MNPGAFRKGTMAQFPLKLATPSDMSRDELDWPPITGSFIVAHVCTGDEKSSMTISSSAAAVRAEARAERIATADDSRRAMIELGIAVSRGHTFLKHHSKSTRRRLQLQLGSCYCAQGWIGESQHQIGQAAHRRRRAAAAQRQRQRGSSARRRGRASETGDHGSGAGTWPPSLVCVN